MSRLLLSCDVTLLTRSVFKHEYKQIHHSCKVLVLGGGTGGCSMAAKLTRELYNPKEVIVTDPNDSHYYQPLFTLIGGGISSFKSSRRNMKDILPKDVKWLKASVVGFEPDANKVSIDNGDTIQYDIMIVALGLQLHWDKIPGLKEGLRDPDAQVCSIYGPETVSEVYSKIKNTKTGTAVFTFPNSPVKCPGAPQKIAYITEDYLRKHNLRNDVNVMYNTALPVIFGVKKYADSLWSVCKQRNINVNLQTNLVKIDPEKKQATFEKLNSPGETWTQEYSLLHVTPPMGPPAVLKEHSALTNEAGFLSVDPKTLRHTKYSNIFGIGDCTNTPNSKTMAAIAAQGKVLYRNIADDLAGKPMTMAYDGYASCPLVTGYGKCILAEFDYNLQPLETFPVNQGKEYYFTYLLKTYFFPFIYWNLMLKGYWNGPEFFRKCTKMLKKD
ncbi:sulfide:quinone oxidoreductase, mitochondrial [Pseudomyrmex gracilis]|uniref:sulfide:quinone oxidoreductase, mitochondrial n=1 Tax=Pseudomyrmex gracilis TaxID=219809 RepID=UPI00099504BA|nr:sulfide:quinone oxidoreductase, mitochondrial [Pseudomyrmex gracilis]XP_020286216.1 sulfide:quinone oxidoreductase, mitochondrial [Pseudomyrmex gracilis]XP_020286217.1 sulfide:quinone oxidoreductase, mitochondrial [Pseudomyrmex gracilis]XP_020286218.1 sulfide:quinone oxidoreductase, mitochondrial [Pseudomyrmex gracilis]XP_020286219.1 sulfide:quinone oxidoreductase, mitochondrial [Pseudomyrmex gracilis]